MVATTRNKLPGGVMLSALAVLGAAYNFAPGFVKGVGLRPAGSTSNAEDPQEWIRVRVGLGGSKEPKTLLRSLDGSTAAQMLHDWASGLVPAKDKIVYGCSSTCETVTIDSLVQGRMRNKELGAILPSGIEEIQLVAGSPDLFEEMPVEGAKFPDGEWSYAMGSIRKALGINADDLIEDRYAAAARKKHRPPDKTKLDKYLEHLRTQAEEAIGDEVKKMDEDEKDDPGRKLDHQRKLVKLIFAWRNLNGPKGWEGFPEIDKSKLIQISVSAVTALVEHAQASDEMARPRRFVPRAFSFLCRYYGLLGGEFRDALKSAWVAPLPEQNRLPAQVFKDLVYLVERELTHTHHTMRAVVQGSRNVTLRTVKFNQAIAASHLQDLEAMASKVEAGGPVRFFDSFGELKTETRVGWPQKALDDFADQFYRRGRGSKIVLVEGKSKFRQLVLAKLKSDLATTVKISRQLRAV